jgi:hypothetical protein
MSIISARNNYASRIYDTSGEARALGRPTAVLYHHLQSAITKMIMNTRTRFM